MVSRGLRVKEKGNPRQIQITKVQNSKQGICRRGHREFNSIWLKEIVVRDIMVFQVDKLWFKRLENIVKEGKNEY